MRRLASNGLAAFASAILTASLVCTWAVGAGASPQWRLLFRPLCHGIVSRCLVLFGAPMPICARCTAIYGGILIGVLLLRLLPELRERTARTVLIAAALPMAIDGGTQLLRLRESTNLLRVGTGLAFGTALAIWLLSGLQVPSAPGVDTSVHSP
jgi:uncharacterized membrane protein